MNSASDQALRDLDEYIRDYLRDDLAELVQSDDDVIKIDYGTFKRARPDMADDLLKDPERIEGWFEEALENHDFPVPVNWSKYDIRFVNIADVDGHPVHDVGLYQPSEIAEDFVTIRGQVSNISDKTIKLRQIVYECLRCGTMNTVPQSGDGRDEPHECQGCERQGPFRADLSASQDYSVDFQTIRLQVLPEKTESFRSNTIDIELEQSLVGDANPGDRVAVNSIAEMRFVNEDSNDVELYGNAKSIDKLDATFDDIPIDEHRDRIEEIAAGDPLEDIATSLAPEHFGDEEIKAALALQLFSAPDVQTTDGTKKRGKIHIFLVGDPGVDKSGLLRRVKQIAPRSVFTTGAGSTAAGLTCAAVQDDFGESSWTIRAGALVEAHEGICAIDELDDMDEDDRAGLLEAMSDQEINRAVAGMNPTLPANTTVLAAANPVHGRFDRHQALGEQIDVDPALFSRFDLIFAMTDDIDPEYDRELADHITSTFQQGQQNTKRSGSNQAETDAPLDDDELRAYVAAAHEIVPVITDEAKQKITNEYAAIRGSNDDDGPVPTTPRVVEALNRISAAHARMRLGEKVLPEDVEIAKKMVRTFLKNVGIDPEEGDFDADVLETGTSNSQRQRIRSIKSIIKSEEEDSRKGVPIETVKEFAADMDIPEQKVDKTIEKLKNKGEIYEPRTDHFFTS